MTQLETNSRIDRLMRERWAVEETLSTLKAAIRQLLRDHAGFDRMRIIASQLQAAIRANWESSSQHFTVPFNSFTRCERFGCLTGTGQVAT